MEYRKNARKALEVVLWFANREPGIDVHRVLKLLFFADIRHLNRYGRPVVGDNYCALHWGPARAEEIEHREFVEHVIDFLEIQAIRKVPVGRLPYGLQKRVELGRALAAQPNLLLLDEPMAGMNVEEKEDMCRFVLDVNEEFGTTIALIEHDMAVVMDISDRVIVLDYGRKIADGTPDEVRGNQDVIDAYLGVAHDEDSES